MTDAEYTPPAPLLEALCAYEAFRRLGFEPDDLHVVFGDGPDGKLRVGMQARNPFNGVAFVVRVEDPLTEAVASDCAAAWVRAAEWWNAGGAMTSAYENSLIRANSVGLLTALQARGMYPIKIEGAHLAN